ncbi:MAG: hypothetical protein JXB88_24055, partial [Spirochaetales bacterium]|nr:hypothetical protein [Spirochaetales bacterium]
AIPADRVSIPPAGLSRYLACRQLLLKVKSCNPDVCTGITDSRYQTNVLTNVCRFSPCFM